VQRVIPNIRRIAGLNGNDDPPLQANMDGELKEMIVLKVFWQTFRGWLILMSVVVSLLLTEKSVRSYGDTLQIALPVAAFLCTRSKKQFANLGTRFIVLEAIVHGFKNLLGSA